MGKRSRIKQVFSPPPPEPAPQDGVDTLEDDLFAALDARDAETRKEAATVLQSVESAKSDEAVDKSKKDSRNRFQARVARKAEKLVAAFSPTDESTDARLQKEIKEEEDAILGECKAQGLQMIEIPPDGHCMYTAIADQLALLGFIPPKAAVPATTRTAAANYIFAHSDSFLPFLPSVNGEDGEGAESGGLLSPKEFETYCARVRDTGEWGGEPEIMALASAYKVPIHVVQSGPQRVVVHEPVDGQLAKPGAIVKISYHRRMYGLGEHYNSLRPKTAMESTPSVNHVRGTLNA